MTIIYFLLCGIAPILVYIKTKDKYHPLIFFSLFWYFFALISSLEILYNINYQEKWNAEMHASIILSGVCIILPTLFFGKKKRKLKSNKTIDFKNKKYRIILNSLLFIAFFSFIFRFSKNNLIPTIFLKKSSDLKDLVPDPILFFHYVENSFPYFSIICFFELLYSKKLTKMRKIYLISWIIFINVVYSIMYCISRGNLVIFLFGSIYIYSIKKLIKYKTLFFLGVICFIGLIAIANLRMIEGSFLTTAFDKYSKNSNILKILSSIYIYISYSFENLRKLIVASDQKTYYYMSLKFLIYPFRKSWYLNNVTINNYETLFLNAKPYIYYFYHDLKLIGIILYNLLIGSYITKLVNKSYKRSIEICKIALLQKFIFFSVLGNILFGETIIFISYILCFIVLNTLNEETDVKEN